MDIRWASVGLLLALVAGAAPAEAQTFRWVDDEGNPHYVGSIEQVPEQYRSQFEPTASKKDEVVPGPGSVRRDPRRRRGSACSRSPGPARSRARSAPIRTARRVVGRWTPCAGPTAASPTACRWRQRDDCAAVDVAGAPVPGARQSRARRRRKPIAGSMSRAIRTTSAAAIRFPSATAISCRAKSRASPRGRACLEPPTGIASKVTGECTLRVRGTEQHRASSSSYPNCEACWKALDQMRGEPRSRAECLATSVQSYK